MKNLYEKPEAEIVMLAPADIVTNSGGEVDEDLSMGGGTGSW